MTSEYQVIKADLTRDRQAILKVWERNGVNMPETEKHFFWAYENNPFGQGPIFLLIHKPSHHVVGSAGLILRRMKVGNAVRIVGRAGGFAVDKAHRFLGPALLLEKALLSDMENSHISLVYTFAPPKAKPVFKRLSYGNYGSVECFRKLIRTPIYVENRLQFLPRFAQNSVLWLLDFGVQVLSKESWSLIGKGKMIRIHHFDERFDDLWSRTASQYSFVTERSSVFLNWRFLHNPGSREFICYALMNKNGSLRGYATYYLDKEHNAHIMDFLAEDQFFATKDLLTALAHCWRDDGVRVAFFRCIGSNRFVKEIEKMGFSTKGTFNPLPYELFISTLLNNTSKSEYLELDWCINIADDFHDFL